jgi:hypothetical protein
VRGPSGTAGHRQRLSVRLTEGLSPARNAAPQPALPADGPVRSLRQQFSKGADILFHLRILASIESREVCAREGGGWQSCGTLDAWWRALRSRA